ncbi:MAG: Rpn family recombination-promoting nuclease/putative transposase [Microscillaceae bacterium]
MKERYINPFTDFGFKKIFGEEANKDLLMDFLNELIKERGKIVELNFLNTEQLGVAVADRKAVFDLYCVNEKGERFIVELQKAKQRYFKDRSLYYTTFAIQEQAVKNEWDFQLQGIYTVAIMDFIFDDLPQNKAKLRHNIQLMDTDNHTIFYDKLNFIYLEMPKFTKKLEELETHYDKWLYLLKNLYRLERKPLNFKEAIFKKLFEVAEIANYDEKERYAYHSSLKYYRDLKNVIDTAVEEAVKITKDNTKSEIAKALKDEGVDWEVIMKTTQLTKEEIEKL